MGRRDRIAFPPLRDIPAEDGRRPSNGSGSEGPGRPKGELRLFISFRTTGRVWLSFVTVSVTKDNHGARGCLLQSFGRETATSTPRRASREAPLVGARPRLLLGRPLGGV